MNQIIIMIAVLIGIAAYLLMSRSYIRWFYGFILFTSVINILLLTAGRIYWGQPAFVNGHSIQQMANPLPQALILTAIVISFSLVIFSLVILRSLFIRNHSLQDKTRQNHFKRLLKRREYG